MTSIHDRFPVHVERLQPDRSLTARTLDRLVFERGFPLTAPGVTTFAYRGDVDSVRLVHFGIGLPDDLEFDRVTGSDWWLLVLALPAGTRLEYKLLIRDGAGERDIEDPLNPFESRNPFGQNSVCRSHGYRVPPWALRDPAAEPGVRRSLTVPSRALGRPVHLTLHLPAAFVMEPAQPYPLVIMHDGSDYLHYANAGILLDNLLHRSLLPEVVVAFCDPVERLTEYADHEAHARFVVEELVPYLEDHVPVGGRRENRALGGASFGAVATLSTAVRYPDAFSLLLLQSGSFDGAGVGCAPRPDPLWEPVNRFVGRYLEHPRPVADRVFMSCGLLEPLICENRAMRPILASSGMEVVLGEVLDGHTWGCWRDLLGVGLPWLFGDRTGEGRGSPDEPTETSASLPREGTVHG